MFSVDNFYDFLDSHYGRKKTDTLLLRFKNDGSKSFQDFVAVSDSRESRRSHVAGFAMLHDQETFDHTFISTYRQWLYQLKNNETWLTCSDEEIFMAPSLGLKWPILCHSEKNSDDIAWAIKAGAIDCYYFWHGLIARDWFRHWRHHADLQDRPKSWSKRFLLYARAFDGTRQYRKTLIENLYPLKDHIQYHWDENCQVGSDHSAKISVDDARKTAIHLVAETLFSTSKIHATEKIFKPIVMRQPFIVAGAPGILQYLRDYGFKTFSDCWDESYDLEIDHDIRLKSITKIINDLASLSEKEFMGLMDRCQHVVAHNRNYFYSDDFENTMLYELKNNWNIALEKQNQMSLQRPGGNLCWVVDKVLSRNSMPTDSMWLGLRQAFGPNTNDVDQMAQIQQRYPWAVDIMNNHSE